VKNLLRNGLEGVEPHRNGSRLIKGMKVLLPYLFTKQFASVGYEIFWKMIHNSKLMGLELKEEFVFRG
jgi:hypothetical protein